MNVPTTFDVGSARVIVCQSRYSRALRVYGKIGVARQQPLSRNPIKNIPTCRIVSCQAAQASSDTPIDFDNNGKLVYDGVIFDMDGTLTISNIDYVQMRKSIDIPVGDLFTVMESWDDGERIKKSMDTILEIEAVAAAEAQPMPGLLELLAFLRDSPAKVGLVTRNTTDSVNAFFSTIGEEWRDVFDIILTREFRHVKPDKRCLLHFAEAWSMPPHSLLMVGDSSEDVECGNAAGTATCLIAGGGNETSATPTAPPLGAVPTFEVKTLHDLALRLEQRNTALGWRGLDTSVSGASLSSMDGSSSSSSESDDASMIVEEQLTLSLAAGFKSDGSEYEEGGAFAGAPPPGIEFIDAMFEYKAVQPAYCSFPRIDGARFGVPGDDHPGSKVLHLQCGDGGLSKLIFSTGLRVIGVDPHPEKAVKRGLLAMKVPSLKTPGALRPVTEAAGPFTAVVLVGGGAGPAASSLEEQLLTVESLQEVKENALQSGGKLCVELELRQGQTVESVEKLVKGCGYSVDVLKKVGPQRIRLFATVV